MPAPGPVGRADACRAGRLPVRADLRGAAAGGREPAPAAWWAGPRGAGRHGQGLGRASGHRAGPRAVVPAPAGHGLRLERARLGPGPARSEEHTSELQSRPHLVCRLLLEKKKQPSLNLTHNKKKTKTTK